MVQVVMESWREGLEKVSLTKLQINMLGMSLKASKYNVDFLLGSNAVYIEIENLEIANKFIEGANKIGVNCRVVK